MFDWFHKFVAYRRWIKKGKPMLKYSGFNCGLCGAWHSIPFEVPEYKSAGQWWDTWGMCPNGCDEK